MSQAADDLGTTPARVEEPRVHLIPMDGSWLHNDGLHISLLQTLHAASDDIIEDASRSHAVNAIRALLYDSQEIRNHGLDGGGQPSVIVGPELAIGSDDWETVNEAVQASSGQRLVIIGCGHTRGAWITEWLSQNTGSTARLPGWPDGTEQILAARPYNVGFAWVKTPCGITCILFLKNSIDQSGEQQLAADLATGTWLVRLQATDLAVFPLICSDFHRGIAGEAGGISAAARICGSLQSTPLTSQRLLVTGCSHTDKPGHGLWDRALTHIFEQVYPNPLIALANGASCLRGEHMLVCSADSVADAWRNRTGVYKPVPAGAEQNRVNSPLPWRPATTPLRVSWAERQRQ